MTIAEFLLARIAEDEAAAGTSFDPNWTAHPDRVGQPIIDAVGNRLATAAESVMQHIARHDPARVLAECEAKRRIVERYVYEHERVLSYRNPRWEDGMTDGDRIERRLQEARNATAEALVRALAVVYDDHPDYDEAWRP